MEPELILLKELNMNLMTRDSLEGLRWEGDGSPPSQGGVGGGLRRPVMHVWRFLACRFDTTICVQKPQWFEE